MTTKTEDTPAKRARPRRLTPVAPAHTPTAWGEETPWEEPTVIEYRGYRILDFAKWHALDKYAPITGITDKNDDWVNCDLTLEEAKVWIDEKIERGELP